MLSEVTTANETILPRVSPRFVLLLAVAIFISDLGCVLLATYTGRVAAIWIANAIFLASLLKHDHRDWPRMIGVALFAYFGADMFSHDRAWTAAGLAFANTIEVLIVAIPMRWLGFDRVFSRTEVLLLFYALVLGGAGVASALLAGLTLHLTIGAPLFAVARRWYGADVLG